MVCFQEHVSKASSIWRSRAQSPQTRCCENDAEDSNRQIESDWKLRKNNSEKNNALMKRSSQTLRLPSRDIAWQSWRQDFHRVIIRLIVENFIISLLCIHDTRDSPRFNERLSDLKFKSPITSIHWETPPIPTLLPFSLFAADQIAGRIAPHFLARWPSPTADDPSTVPPHWPVTFPSRTGANSLFEG